MSKTEEFLKENNFKYYKENDIINIQTSLRFNLTDLTEIDDDLFNDCKIYGSLDLESVRTVGSRCFNNCTILGYLDLGAAQYIGKDSIQNCDIGGFLCLSRLETIDIDLLLNSKIESALDLSSLYSMPENSLKTCTMRELFLSSLEYLPKNFKINPEDKIHLNNLKSGTLKRLLLHPGPERTLGFNLLKKISGQA